MILNTPSAATEITMSGVEDSMGFELDSAATAHILNMLRSGVYRDAKLACVREYWCNARDSVIEAGKDPTQHVTIFLPNSYDSNFRIKDEGMGLSETDFRRIFRKYGRSTKRDSNDGIGCLGIGSKAAFAYSDTFTVTAVKNGIKRIFIATVARDSIGEDGVGSLNRIVEEPTDEPNGVEISIPVKKDDFDDFYRKTAEFLSFVPVSERPIVRGLKSRIVDIPERTAIYSGPNWRITSSSYSHTSYAIMGGVPYRIDVNSLDKFSKEEKTLIEIGVDLIFPIGSLDFAISREELRYTELTRKTIRAALKEVVAEVYRSIEGKIANASSYLEAVRAFADLKAYHSFDRIFLCDVASFKKGFKWNDVEIHSADIYIDEKFSEETHLYSVARNNNGLVSRFSLRVLSLSRAISAPKFVLHDAKRYGEWQRCSSVLASLEADTNLTEQERSFILMRFDTPAAQEDFITRNNLKHLGGYTNLSTFERDPKMVRKPTARTAKVFTLDADSTTGWTPELEDEIEDVENAYWVEYYGECARFRGDKVKDIDADEVAKMVLDLESWGVKVETVFACKPSVLPRVQSKYKNFFTLYREEAKKYLIQIGFRSEEKEHQRFKEILDNGNVLTSYYAQYMRRSIVSYLTNLDGKFMAYIQLLDSTREHFKKAATNSPVDAAANRYIRFGGNMSEVIDAVSSPLSAELQQFKDAHESFNKTFPMLRCTEAQYDLSDEKAQIIANYVNERDV